MVVSIEQHVNWIADALQYLRNNNLYSLEATPKAQEAWVTHVNDYGNLTLYPQANSWYMGANVPGKPRVFLPYVGGVDRYRQACDEVVQRCYLGFEQSGAETSLCNEGRIRFVKPDVQLLLELLASLEQPTLDSLSPKDASCLLYTSPSPRDS